MPRKTMLAVLLTVLAAVLAPMAPALGWMRAPGLDTLARIILPPAKTPDSGPAVRNPRDEKPAETAKTPVETAAPGGESPDAPVRAPGGEPLSVVSPTEVLDPQQAMTPFYEALRRAEMKQGSARILHYGDSPVTADSITADARALFQRQFGDAGHGFILAGKPWNWYQHRGMEIKASGWTMEPLSQAPRARDHLHGLGGVNFRGGVGAVSRIRMADRGHTRVEVLYLKQPEGGEFKVEAMGRTLFAVQTSGELKTSGFAAGELPEDAEEVKLMVTRGNVRIFGFLFEKPSQTGVMYTSLGLNGASTQSLLRYMDMEHWAEQIRHQKADLIVLNYGTNESVYPRYVDTLYENELRQVLQRMKSAAPNAAVMVMSPMDRGERSATGQIVTPPVMERIVAVQKRVALETGCAFFNTYEAMGGAGTMAKWYAAKPRLVNADYIHPLPGGAAIVGGLLNGALLQGYKRWKAGVRP